MWQPRHDPGALHPLGDAALAPGTGDPHPDGRVAGLDPPGLPVRAGGCGGCVGGTHRSAYSEIMFEKLSLVLHSVDRDHAAWLLLIRYGDAQCAGD